MSRERIFTFPFVLLMAAYALGRGIAGSGLFFVASGLMLAVSRLTAGRLERR